jgi:hypothetical protein
MPDDQLVANDLLQVITAHARGADRSIQIEIGPSEIGQTCERRLAMALLGSKRPNISRDEWTAAVGTACHAWVEGAFAADNDRLMREGKPPRWLIETEIEIRPGLFGHCDLYDLVTNTVIDHKFPGVTSIRKYRKNNHPGQQYEWQAHLYGRGWELLGLPVRDVALIMYPRSGLLRDAWMWKEPYDRDIAEQAFKRMDDLLVGMNMAEGAGVMADFMLALDRDTEHCSWCPYYVGNQTDHDPADGCKGPFYEPDFEETRHDQRISGILS